MQKLVKIHCPTTILTNFTLFFDISAIWLLSMFLVHDEHEYSLLGTSFKYVYSTMAQNVSK